MSFEIKKEIYILDHFNVKKGFFITLAGNSLIVGLLELTKTDSLDENSTFKFWSSCSSRLFRPLRRFRRRKVVLPGYRKWIICPSLDFCLSKIGDLDPTNHNSYFMIKV